MIVKGIIFDNNGTLSDIQTNEWHDDVYRVISNLLSYQGILLDPNVVKDLYFQIMKEQRAASGERHPEFDAIGIFREIITRYSTDFTRGLPAKKIARLPRLLAETHRAASRLRLQLYPGVEDTIRQLHTKYHLAIISDGQTACAVPELNAVGLSGYFDPIIISGDFGYRKPDERLFTAALTCMKMEPSEVVFVGNDMYRDVYGAQRLGMKTVFFKSNQGTQEKEGVKPDYIIYNFPELLNAIRFFEER
ncbi:HAD family hydrolase [Sulfuriferula plumbiphila]|uniref:HAD family hydrolase n=1 Tax=Sulfuriferula plumbiphila TaxID=171865 RepID=A0A512L3G8_9PROT|nr:HAD family hydrolase [Sulfuriferula plumbiphila]BBP02714.1 HAD family hydrolase [Sulfuriferula plumbiphila]GEP29008.1 HAD family hydrolase [Sulfuriferula plumbiphila]